MAENLSTQSFSIDEVLNEFVVPNTGAKSHSIKVTVPEGTFDVYVNSSRYKMFSAKGCTCVKCGLTANTVRLVLPGRITKKTKQRAHFNFYHENENGGLRLFTKDHIISRANGGKDVPENYQPMCAVCNNRKSKRNTEAEIKWGIEHNLINPHNIKEHNTGMERIKLPKSLVATSREFGVVMSWLKTIGVAAFMQRGKRHRYLCFAGVPDTISIDHIYKQTTKMIELVHQTQTAIKNNKARAK